MISLDNGLNLDYVGAVVLMLVRPQKYRENRLHQSAEASFPKVQWNYFVFQPLAIERRTDFSLGCYELCYNTPELQAQLDVYLPGKPAFDFLYGSKEKAYQNELSVI